jgi:thiol-disulfide isomerase/thioredoxin
MKQFIMRRWIYVLIAILGVACGRKDAKNQFEVSGVIKSSTAKVAYLEEVAAGSTQGTIVDSSAISKDGRYKLKADMRESVVYNLRLDQNEFPVAAVVNDVPKITLNIELKNGDNQFADNYEVKGSPVSQEMKDFMYTFGNELQKIYFLSRQRDSLHKKNVADSEMAPLVAEWKRVADNIREYSLNALNKANDPALFIFELGYYQSTANEEAFGLMPVGIEQVIEMVGNASKRYPTHQGLNAVKNKLDEQLAEMKKANQPRWVGKPAPDFSLPDVNGNQVALSSFKGKFVLVDFWASWCDPCRAENPNVVKAYAKFKDKNFTILGVSLDRPGQKNKWIEAIKSDNLTWTQVSELKYWDSRVVPLYGIDGIPYNVLINTEGIVIGENLKGRALEAKLEEVLK